MARTYRPDELDPPPSVYPFVRESEEEEDAGKAPGEGEAADDDAGSAGNMAYSKPEAVEPTADKAP